MTKTDLLKLKETLLKKKEDILHIVKKAETGVGSDVGDSVDIASDSTERELLFELTDNERMILLDIENALQKMEKNLYGKCESCSSEISVERLRVVPFARYCINCQSKMETKK